MSYEVLEPGLYPFTIEDANIRYVSKAGNTSLRLVLKIEHNGKFFTTWDYLTYKKGPDGKDFPFIVKKKEELLKTIGQEFFINKLDMLENETFIGKRGKCVVKIESHPDYGDQIKVVKYYVSPADKAPVREAKADVRVEDPGFSDEDINNCDIPF